MNISHLHSTLTSQSPMSADNPKLQPAAHEFEASLMQEFLKPLQHDPLFASDKSDGSDGSGSSTDSDDSEGPGSAGALMSFGSEAMARAISERGGFGIATKILDHFRTASQTASASKRGEI